MTPTFSHRSLQSVDQLADFAAKPTEKPLEKSVRLGFGAVSVRFLIRIQTTEADRIFAKNRKKDRVVLFSVHNYDTRYVLIFIYSFFRGHLWYTHAYIHQYKFHHYAHEYE